MAVISRSQVRRLAFFKGEAEGAIPNGTRVVKVKTEPGDGHEIGALATVKSSFRVDAFLPAGDPEEFVYFVEWDDLPGVPIFVKGSKIGRAA